MADTQNTNVQEQDIHQLLKVKREKLANLQQAGKDPFQITKYDVTHHSTDIKNNFEELEGKTVRIAGRVMSKRVMGKASFCNVQDLPGNIQVYVARDSIGEESYADFKKYDVASKCISRIQATPSASKKMKDRAYDLKEKIVAEIKNSK